MKDGHTITLQDDSTNNKYTQYYLYDNKRILGVGFKLGNSLVVPTLYAVKKAVKITHNVLFFLMVNNYFNYYGGTLV